MRIYKFVLILIVSVLCINALTACGSPQAEVSESVTADDIIGTWGWQSGSFFFQFRDDGTFRVSNILSNLNTDVPQDIGTYVVENGILTLTSGEMTRFCNEGEIGKYALSFGDNGELELLLQSDECKIREAPPSLQIFTRVEGG